MRYDDFHPMDTMGPGVKSILAINVGVFIVIAIFSLEDQAVAWFALDPFRFAPWQALTYAFLHLSLWHLFCNILGLICFAGAVESAFGTRFFLIYYLVCGLGGALLAYLLAPLLRSGVTLGASGAIFGVLYACYRLFPGAVVYFLVFPLRLKYLLLVFFLLDLASLAGPASSGTASWAHIGGVLAGFLWFRFEDPIQTWWQGRHSRQERRLAEREAVFKERVDEILAKITREGMNSLTRKEREYLRRASEEYAQNLKQR